jgi:ABC-type sugar transport system ATPase subunit
VLKAEAPDAAVVPSDDKTRDSAPLLLEVSDLSKGFGGIVVLDQVSLRVRPGTIHALLGENGAGKSTLIKVVAGALQPDGGEIRIAGDAVQFKNPQDAQAKGIAVVHQHANLVKSLSVQENLWLGTPLPRHMGALIHWGAVTRQAQSLLERVGLDIDPRASVDRLRPDEVAMLSIAKAIVTDAKLIVLDEPTASLVPREVDIVLGHMRRLAKSGHGFVYVSHRLQEVLDIADEATVLRDGKVVWTCDRSEMTRQRVVRAIVGDKALAQECAPLPAPALTAPPVLEAIELAGNGVAGLSLQLRAGEIVGLAGLPGSGAEEALELLYGRRHVTAGRLVLNGRTITLRSPRDAVRAGIALVPKDRLAEATIATFSVGKNITLPSLARFITDPVLRIVKRGHERRSALQLAQQLNVKMPSLDIGIGMLSGGNQQKAVLARWIGTQAPVFLLNSPTAAVDVGAKAEIYELLIELARSGTAVLFTTTEMEEFARICQRVIVFKDQRVVAELAGSDITEDRIVALSVGETLEKTIET